MQALARTSLRRTATLHRRRNKRAIAPHLPAASQMQDFAGLAHDLRNVLASLELYCELLSAPGVLSTKYRHYAPELRSVSATSMQLMRRLEQGSPAFSRPGAEFFPAQAAGATSGAIAPAVPNTIPNPIPNTIPDTIDDLARELPALRPLLAAVAGPGVSIEIECLPCAGAILLTREDLTRILINLVRNAAEAMGGKGRIRITAQYGGGQSFFGEAVGNCPSSVVLAVQDSGPGIPERLREQVFAAGFTAHAAPCVERGQNRGLGLSIVRMLAESARGSARAISRKGRGACFEVELPVTYGMYGIGNRCGFSADSN